ncbi:hypothetical protein Vid5_gp33 [Pantoea phage vB_PagS_Vid5]|uniref:DUF7352 domain-containing protein n=1 Tax=Pantoea phage vB_PagS_Vid5 TaxID=2099652 RepID=A0A2P1CKS9_9CAUD|nr:hypothetical protein FDJ45_gp033 [Pantoea phage vB_PagS_Vid5]AVJ51788.1 hypothetical protein Vid5_gp33 [Pantoea phage vB_PagS_Vid5]
MAKQIIKELFASEKIEVNAPVGSKVIMVAQQKDRVGVWFEAPSAIGIGKELRIFKLFVTGAEVPRHAQHIGSVVGDDQMSNLVFHVYEV